VRALTVSVSSIQPDEDQPIDVPQPHLRPGLAA
jgi:hypothetical protein